MPLTKFIRVATEGATSDGRTIERSWIEQMAASYDRTKYAARVWLEHLRGTLPDSPFRAYGDVIALKTETIDIAGQKKLALLAQIDGTSDMVSMVKARQKLYSSIEVNPKFADSGEAYLVGIGITDSPASLGTEMIQFNSTSHALDGRKQAIGNLFTASEEVGIEFEPPAPDPSASLFERIKTLFASTAQQQADTSTAQIDARFSELQTTVQAAITQIARDVDSIKTHSGSSGSSDTSQALEAMRASITSIEARLPDPASFSQRPPATGASMDPSEGF